MKNDYEGSPDVIIMIIVVKSKAALEIRESQATKL